MRSRDRNEQPRQNIFSQTIPKLRKAKEDELLSPTQLLILN